MSNSQLYLMALKKTWWLLGIIVAAIILIGIYEAVENKWETRCYRKWKNII